MRHSLVIRQQGLGIWRHTAEGVEHESDIAADDKNARAAFQGWLAAERRRLNLVADLSDERHAVERLPAASRADRLRLIARKLAQRFPEAAFTRASPLPASQEDGLLKPVRLSSIPRLPALALWLDALNDAAIKGDADATRLTSVPFLIEHWYRRQRALPPHGLLLAFGAAGLRQMLFRQRRLVFSRTVAARADTLAENLPAYRDELAQVLAWLPSQRLIEGSPPILVLAPEADFPLLRELAPNSAVDFIDIARYASGSADAFTLALRETRQRGAPAHYDCPPLRRPRQLAFVRRAAWCVAAASLAIGLANAADGFINAARLNQEAEQFAFERQKRQAELDKLNAESTAEAGADFPDDWLAKAESLASDTGIAPLGILQAIAGLLAQAPWARLETLAWKKQPMRESAPDDAPSASIVLEISLIGSELPQTAADKLLSFWQQRYGSSMKAHIDPATSRLRLDTTLRLLPREKQEKPL
ncbi:MAG: hypothetical protein LBU76_07110 [Azoarcus sp.]|jgi:hypothetical protein|nr:hypothetical protein [Azoarcus sp.]